MPGGTEETAPRRLSALLEQRVAFNRTVGLELGFIFPRQFIENVHLHFDTMCSPFNKFKSTLPLAFN